MKRLLLMLVVLCCVLSVTVWGIIPVNAAVTEYFGEDLGQGESVKLSSWPNASAAQAAFLSRLVGVGTEDFESFAVNALAPLTADFGTAGTATLQGDGNISSQPSGTNGFGRYPTSGSQYWEVTGQFSIEFAQPIAAFGFYGVDIGDFNGQVVLQLVNGGTRSFTLNNTIDGLGGAVLFYGIIEEDPTLQFTKVTFSNTAEGVDYFGFDDFTIGTLEQVTPDPVNPVPETSTMLLFGAGLVLVVGLVAWKTKRAAA